MNRYKILFLGLMVPSITTQALARNDMGVGFNLGWEATYGTGVSYHYLYNKYLEFNGGFGYNFPSVKVGAGTTGKWPFSRHFGMRGTGALVYTSSTKGEVVLEAKFKPENSSEEEDITGLKTYSVSSAIVLGTAAGMYWNINRDTQLVGDITYNFPITGNDVSLSDDIQYSRDIEASNHTKAEEDFDEEAEYKAKTGGLGANIGIRFLF